MPSSGTIYFARTGSGKTKVGRTSRNPLQREKELRTGDPDLRIVYAYQTEDAIREEHRVHTKLRLVAGTEYRGPGREVYDVRPDKALELATEPATPKLVVDAHAAVMACQLDSGLTVEQALRWVCGGYEAYDDEIVTNIHVELDSVGLSPYCAQDNELEGYGHIVWLDTLLGAFPGLRTYETVLRENKVLFSA